MILVGIHDNTRIFKALKNDRGTLVVGWKVETPAEDLLASFNDVSTNSSEGDPEHDFLFFPPQVTAKDNSGIDTPQNNSKKIKQLKDQLNYILMQYMTQDKIKWDILKDTGVTATNTNDKFVEQGVLDKIYSNIVDQFITMISPYLNRTDLLFRTLFIRQSKAKHYPALRKTFLDNNPFMEPMSVPKEASRLRYTDWEKEQGMNNPNPVTAQDVPDAEEAATAQSIFNS